MAAGARVNKGECADKSWWNTSCSEKRAAMLAFAGAAPRGPNGKLALSAAQRADFATLRASYRRACKEAKQEHSAKVAEGWLQMRRSDPWSVFRLLQGSQHTPCCQIDPRVWGQHGSALHAISQSEAGADVPLAHRILNLIATKSDASFTFPSFDAIPSDESLWRTSSTVASRQSSAACLNVPIGVEEVVTALDGLAFNKAAGPDALPGEAWRCAREQHATQQDQPGLPILAQPIHSLFTHIFSDNDFPTSFRISNWGPIFKKGDPSLPANYRGIAVGNVLCKLYMTVLTRRISKWAIEYGLRHKAQAGFMRRMSVCHHQFVMRHLVTRYSTKPAAARGKQWADNCKGLYVCQIDFAKAFDKVPHHLLWERLRERGMHGHMLDSLINCYSSVLLQPKVNGRVGTPFSCQQGVKQGDPASPDLFGLFIETLADFIDAMDAKGFSVVCPESGVTLQPHQEDTPIVDGGSHGAQFVASLLFADDVNLLALSAERMNYLLALLDIFCRAFGMSVNTSKCELLIFHPEQARRAQLEQDEVRYLGQMLAPKQRARYLGLHYGPLTGKGKAARKSLFVDCWHELLAAGKVAARTLHAKLCALGLHIPHTMLEFYNTCVGSILSFGAQVWSTAHLTVDFAVAMKHEMVIEQRAFLRKVLGAQRPSNHLLYMELSQLPLQHHWAILVFRFWNSMVKDDSTLCHGAFRSDLRMAFECKTGWAHDVISFLRTLEMATLALPTVGPEFSVDALVEHYSKLHLPVEALQEEVAKKLRGAFSNPCLFTADGAAVEPRSYHGDTPTICRYMHWMGMPAVRRRKAWKRQPLLHTKQGVAHARHVSLMRFRTCTWDLQVNRSYNGKRSREERVCRLCVSAGLGYPVEDEKHVLIECPAHQQLRMKFADLDFTQCMLDFMTKSDQGMLAQYINQLKDSLDCLLDADIGDTVCHLCKNGDNAKDMLLCDGRCCRGFHMQCLNPSPERPSNSDAWFCPECTIRINSRA